MGYYYQDEIFNEIHYVDEKDNDFYKRGCGCLISILIIGCLSTGIYFIVKKSNNNKKQTKTEKIQKDIKNNTNKVNTALFSNFVKNR